MIRRQLKDDPPLIQGKLPLATLLVDAPELAVGLHVRRVTLKAAQAEPKRAIEIASLAVRSSQLHERRRIRVRSDFSAQLLQRSTSALGH